MALEANGQRFCKVVHTENGRTSTRRIHSMMVQAADGRLHYLDDRKLPDSMTFFTGIPYRGAHAADVLLSPKDARGIPFLANQTGWLNKRDAVFIVLGMFIFRLIAALAEAVAQALS